MNHPEELKTLEASHRCGKEGSVAAQRVGPNAAGREFSLERCVVDNRVAAELHGRHKKEEAFLFQPNARDPELIHFNSRDHVVPVVHSGVSPQDTPQGLTIRAAAA